jgi:hypothetical protein
MKRKWERTSGLVLLLLLVNSSAYSQEPFWRIRFFSFFDNNEFGGSALKIPQTMSGIQLAPEAGFVWDSIHKVSAGVNLLHEFGSVEVIDKFYPTAYYELDRSPFRFVMGAFPRSMVMHDYQRLFFQDSIFYYRPNVNGIFLEYFKDRGFLNLWLDWTGRQSENVHETFFMGLSGRFNFGPVYAKHSDYVYHFARKLNPVVDEAFHDNLLFQTSVGADLSDKTFFTKLDASAGWILGLERARADNTGWISLNGLLVEARVEYRFIGFYNSFYIGDGLMYFYRNHGNDIYWGDPVYRAKTYNRSDLYLKFLESKYTDIELTYSLHFLEGTVYHEQMLKVKVNLDRR